MNIIALIRPKPLLQPAIRLAPLRGELTGSIAPSLADCLDDLDRFAIDHAVHVRNLLGHGQVLVVSTLPEAAEPVLRECFLRGAADIVRVHMEPPAKEDPAAMLLALGVAIQGIDHDLLLMAHPALDDDLGNQCRTLAHLLRLKYLPRSQVLEFTNTDEILARVYDRLGQTREVRALLPCALSVFCGPPRILGIRNLKQVFSKNIKTLHQSSITNYPPSSIPHTAKHNSRAPRGGALSELSPARNLWPPSMQLYYNPLTPERPLFSQIQAHGFELDQRLQWVFRLACKQSRPLSTLKNKMDISFDEDEDGVCTTGGCFAGWGMNPPELSKFQGVRDSFILPFFIASEPLLQDRFFGYAKGSSRLEKDLDYLRSLVGEDLESGLSLDIEREAAGPAATRVFSRAMFHAARRRSASLRWQDIFYAALELGASLLDEPYERPMFIDWIVEQTIGPLQASIPKERVRPLLVEMKTKMPSFDGDFQFVVTLQEGKPVFRICSPLGDYAQELGSGTLMPRRALLLHYKDRYWEFTPDQIDELNDLMQSEAAGELDFQRFFERCPHFLRRFDYREVYPQLILARGYSGNLIPDFILTDSRAQAAMILELKHPKARVVVHQENRLRFSAAVMEARAQLQTYREWFRSRLNRQRIQSITGLDVFEPRLAVVIGRSREFRTPFERRVVSRRASDIEVVTYDDIVNYAESRKTLVRRIWTK